MNKSSVAYVVLFMLGVSVVAGIALSVVHYVTLDTLAKNERFHKNRIVSSAFMLDVEGDSPEAFEKTVDRFVDIKRLVHDGRTWEMYTTTASQDPRVGFLFSGVGFWGSITGILVLSPDLKTISNIRFLEHQETPGLGARIEEPWFTTQFKGLHIAWDKPSERRIVIGGTADSAVENRVDAITGATQTSMALMKSLNTELEAFRKAYSVHKPPALPVVADLVDKTGN